MECSYRRMTYIFALFPVILCLGLVIAQLISMGFPEVPSRSANFDCDDSTLAMYRHFQSLGIESTPIIGNLKMSDEPYAESNHVWLLVKNGGMEIAYDWGTPRFDRQHYEGYTINLDYLLQAVQQDRQASGTLASTGQ